VFCVLGIWGFGGFWGVLGGSVFVPRQIAYQNKDFFDFPGVWPSGSVLGFRGLFFGVFGDLGHVYPLLEL